MKRSAVIATCAAIALGLGVVATISVVPSQAESARPDSGVKPGGDRYACFDPNWVESFQTVSDNKVVVTSNFNQAYELQLAGACIGLDSTFRLGLRSRHGSMDVCGPFDADVVWEDGGRLQTCQVTSVRHLTGDEAAPYVAKPRDSRGSSSSDSSSGDRVNSGRDDKSN